MGNYYEAKRAQQLDLIRSLHGAVAGDEEPKATPNFDGGVRGEPRLPFSPPYLSGSTPSDEPRELGWHEGFDLEDGASLIFPSLADSDGEGP